MLHPPARNDAATLVAARDDLFHVAVEHFRANGDVVAVFFAGSLAAGSGDEWSDIDGCFLRSSDVCRVGGAGR